MQHHTPDLPRLLGLQNLPATFAQGYATIRGTVTDSTGAIIPGAEVTATQANTGLMLKTTTNSEGTFVFPS